MSRRLERAKRSRRARYAPRMRELKQRRGRVMEDALWGAPDDDQAEAAHPAPPPSDDQAEAAQ